MCSYYLDENVPNIFGKPLDLEKSEKQQKCKDGGWKEKFREAKRKTRQSCSKYSQAIKTLLQNSSVDDSMTVDDEMNNPDSTRKDDKEEEYVSGASDDEIPQVSSPIGPPLTPKSKFQEMEELRKAADRDYMKRQAEVFKKYAERNKTSHQEEDFEVEASEVDASDKEISEDEFELPSLSSPPNITNSEHSNFNLDNNMSNYSYQEEMEGDRKGFNEHNSDFDLTHDDLSLNSLFDDNGTENSKESQAIRFNNQEKKFRGMLNDLATAFTDGKPYQYIKDLAEKMKSDMPPFDLPVLMPKVTSDSDIDEMSLAVHSVCPSKLPVTSTGNGNCLFNIS